jgi:hypothetical protein
VCFDINKLGNALKKLAMLIVQETIWNKVTENRRAKKTTRIYLDEFHLLLRDEQTAKYSVEIWKRFRKYQGIPTGITQNVKDFLQSREIESIFENTDFVYLLNQAPGDREILMEKLKISDQQIEFVSDSDPGCGLIKFGEVIIPFTDIFPSDTQLFKLMTTKAGEMIVVAETKAPKLSFNEYLELDEQAQPKIDIEKDIENTNWDEVMNNLSLPVNAENGENTAENVLVKVAETV